MKEELGRVLSEGGEEALESGKMYYWVRKDVRKRGREACEKC